MFTEYRCRNVVNFITFSHIWFSIEFINFVIVNIKAELLYFLFNLSFYYY